jgi:hypothetical protein
MLIDPSGNPSIVFTLYAMEQEGDLPTYQGRRNKMLKNLRQLAIWSPIDESDVTEEAAAAGLGILTDQEINDILNEVSVY